MNSRWMLVVPVLVLLTVGCAAQTAPIERSNYAAVTSHDEMLRFLARLAEDTTRFAVRSIGMTVQGRTIPMIRVRPNSAGLKTKVLLFCQQHGNEPSGKESALALLAKIASGPEESLLTNLDLVIVPSVNPDGNEAGKRTNGNGEDLNRNHLLQTQPEVQALHRLYEEFQPEATLDVHEYSAYRKEFRDVGYVRAVDEQLGAPTNLNTSSAIRSFAHAELYPFLERHLGGRGYTFANYLKMNAPDDTVRPSTTSINDGRQSFAILNRFSFIVEGRNGRKMNDELERRTLAQLAAIEGFLAFVNTHHERIRTMVETESAKIPVSQDSVVIVMDYLFRGERVNLPVVELKTGKDTTAPFIIAPDVIPLRSVSRPYAYLVPRAQTEVIAFLRRHDVQFETVQRPRQAEVERYVVERVRSSWMENKPTWILTTKTERRTFPVHEGDVVVPLAQQRGTMLVIALEPESMWGIVQEEEFAMLRQPGSTYPIMRIETEGRTTR